MEKPKSETAITFRNLLACAVNIHFRPDTGKLTIEPGGELIVEPPADLDGGVFGMGDEDSAYDLPLDLKPGDTKEFYPSIR